jgi:hypothetical protein
MVASFGSGWPMWVNHGFRLKIVFSNTALRGTVIVWR